MRFTYFVGIVTPKSRLVRSWVNARDDDRPNEWTLSMAQAQDLLGQCWLESLFDRPAPVDVHSATKILDDSVAQPVKQ